MRGRFVALTLLVCLGFTGCMTPNKNDTKNSDLMPSAGLGSGNATPGSTSAEDEEWSKMGRQMRGDGPVQQQAWDPLHDLMVSPRAQSIEHSLGVDN